MGTHILQKCFGDCMFVGEPLRTFEIVIIISIQKNGFVSRKQYTPRKKGHGKTYTHGQNFKKYVDIF
jgi:hypothetical protein